jgi:hypothetical protein
VAHGGRERQLARSKAPAGTEENLARTEIKAFAANMARIWMALAYAHRGWAAACWFSDRVFLDDDRIGSGRQRSTSEDAHGLAGCDGAGKGMPRRRRADHSEAGRQASDVTCAHRVSIHGGGIEGWLRQQRGQWLGQRAPVRCLHRSKFDSRRLDAIEDAR